MHTHNLDFVNSDVLHEKATMGATPDVACTDTFMGYPRADGRFGTRNFIVVLSSVNCSATVAHRICDAFDDHALAAFPNVDGVAAFTHGTGCGMDGTGEGYHNLQRVLAGYARHPNVGGVLLVGLGCEMSQISATVESHKLAEGPLLATMNIQTLSLIHI